LDAHCPAYYTRGLTASPCLSEKMHAKTEDP
jgi:hypothetical protein